MQPPLFDRPPDLENPAGLRAWFLEPAVVVDQVTNNNAMTLALAHVLVTDVEKAVQARFVSKGQKVHFLHDWRACLEYEVPARDLLLKWGRESRAHTERISIAMSADANPFTRIATSTAMVALRTIGVKIEMVDDIDALCRTLTAR